MVTECGSLSSFALFRHAMKHAMKVKLQVFYHILSYKSAAASGFIKILIWCITKIKILYFIGLLPVIDLYNS